MSGGSLTTKGLVAGGAAPTPPTPADTTIPPPTPGQFSADTSPIGSILIVVPTALNTCLMAAENITQNLRTTQPANLVLPSLYKRAYLIAYTTDEIAVVKR